MSLHTHPPTLMTAHIHLFLVTETDADTTGQAPSAHQAGTSQIGTIQSGTCKACIRTTCAAATAAATAEADTPTARTARTAHSTEGASATSPSARKPPAHPQPCPAATTTAAGTDAVTKGSGGDSTPPAREQACETTPDGIFWRGQGTKRTPTVGDEAKARTTNNGTAAKTHGCTCRGGSKEDSSHSTDTNNSSGTSTSSKASSSCKTSNGI